MITKRYTVVRTSFGDLFITADRERLIRVNTEQPHIATAMRNDNAPLLRENAQSIVEYLNSKRTTLPTPPLKLLPFQREVFAAVGRIPYGYTTTSAEIARQIGKPHAVRAVETICRTNPYYILVPTHRVIVSGETVPSSKPLIPNEALRRLEKRHLDKVRKRG